MALLPNIAGKGIANPLGSILTSSMMLEFLGWEHEAKVTREGVKAALFKHYLTPDLAGDQTTRGCRLLDDRICQRTLQVK